MTAVSIGITIWLLSLSPLFNPSGSPIASDANQPRETVTVGEDLPVPGQPSVQAPENPQEPPPDAPGTFKLVTHDKDGRIAPRIPISATGPVAKNLVTDAKGVAVLTGPPGIYEFAVKIGCQGPLHILYGAAASRQLLSGANVELKLRTEWQHRIAPAGNADSSYFPFWPIGERVTVTFDLHDRCLEILAPEGSSFPTWRFRTNAILEVLAQPALTADQNSKSKMDVKCVGQGKPSILAHDSENPLDTIDLVDIMLSAREGRGIECKG